MAGNGPPAGPKAENPAFTKGAKPLGAALAGVVGMVAALGLFTATPQVESGRTVQATAQADGGIAVRHVAGPQYLHAYQDVVGVWTACDGVAYVKRGATFTPDQCNAMLEQQLVKHAEGVMACTPGLRPAGHDHQRIAAVLLAYNIGVGGYCRSTVARRFNAHDYRGACDAFLLWNKAGGRVVKGLDNRRRRERSICLQDVG